MASNNASFFVRSSNRRGAAIKGGLICYFIRVLEDAKRNTTPDFRESFGEWQTRVSSDVFELRRSAVGDPLKRRAVFESFRDRRQYQVANIMWILSSRLLIRNRLVRLGSGRHSIFRLIRSIG